MSFPICLPPHKMYPFSQHTMSISTLTLYISYLPLGNPSQQYFSHSYIICPTYPFTPLSFSSYFIMFLSPASQVLLHPSSRYTNLPLSLYLIYQPITAQYSFPHYRKLPDCNTEWSPLPPHNVRHNCYRMYATAREGVRILCNNSKLTSNLRHCAIYSSSDAPPPPPPKQTSL